MRPITPCVERSLPSDQLESRIRAAQAERDDDVVQIQAWIDNGQAWRLEGFVGRTASDALTSGACFLPDEPHRDFWGHYVPARFQLRPGSKGTLENAARFYELD